MDRVQQGIPAPRALQATPSAAAWLGGENGSAATDATADAQQLAPASTALGTSQHSAPATEARMPMMARCMSCTHELDMFCELSHVRTLEITNQSQFLPPGMYS